MAISKLEKSFIRMARPLAGITYPTSWEKLEIDENKSVWASYTPDYRPNPPLEGETTADLAIIGGGFTGISTAYHFSKRYPEKRVVLLEARSLGNGASGRNGGMMLNWIYGVGGISDEMARRIYTATNQTIDWIVEMIQTYNLDVSYRRDGCLNIYTTEESAEEGAREAEYFQSLGIDNPYLSVDDVKQKIGLNNLYGGAIDPNEGQINGAQFTRAFKPILESQGVEIYEGTRVTKITEGRTVIVETEQGAVKAKAIVLATNGYTGKLGYFRKAYFPLHSHVFATKPKSDQELAEAGWKAAAGFSDDLNRLAYATRTKEGQIVFGGGSNESYAYLFNNRTAYPGTPVSARRGFDAMEETLYSYLPAVKQFGISHQWTGTLAISLYRNCSMGVRGEHKNVYYSLGYSGHGVVAANMAGRVLTDIYSGNLDEWRGMPFINAGFAPIPLEPFRWLGYQMFTRFTGRSPRGYE